MTKLEDLKIGDCFVSDKNNQYMVIGKDKYITVLAESLISFVMDREDQVRYLGKGTADIQFCKQPTIAEAAIELNEYLGNWHLFVRIQGNQLHVYWDKTTDKTLPDIWGGYSIKYINCQNKVINF